MEKKWYQKFSNWMTILVCIILIPILVVNVSIIMQANTNKDKVPSVMGYKPFIVLSGSMESKIKKGDLVIVKETDPKKLKKNDVIAFRDEENTVTTHRIIDLVEDNGKTYFITKGDNNESQDQKLVSYKDVEGIYVLRIPMVGNILDALAKPTVIIILVLVITLAFFVGFYTSTKKQREAEHQEFLEFKRQKELQEQQDKKEKDYKDTDVEQESSKDKKTAKKKTK